MVNTVNTQPNGDPMGFTYLKSSVTELAIESRLKSEFLPLVKNSELLKGSVLMAFATLTDTNNPNKTERAESFAFSIASRLIRDVLKIDSSDDQILASPIGFEAIGDITMVCFELVRQGLLLEESVSYDACSYFRVRDNKTH